MSGGCHCGELPATVGDASWPLDQDDRFPRVRRVGGEREASTTDYVCDACGQRWVERFEGWRGFGEGYTYFRPPGPRDGRRGRWFRPS